MPSFDATPNLATMQLSEPTSAASAPLPELQLCTFPHLIESILATAIRSIARPILFASAPHIATYLNVASRRYTGLAPSHAAIYRMPWIDSTLAARLGNLWLMRQLANLATRSGRWYRPLQYQSQDVARHAGALGNLDLVRYIVQETSLLGRQYQLGSAIQFASMHGHVHILDWFAAHSPEAFESLSPGAQFEVPPDTGMGAEYLQVLQWWMDRQHLWVPASDKSRPDWQLWVWVLINACKAKRMDVVEYWLSVQDYKQNEPADPDRLRKYLAEPLAAAAYTGDLEFFDQMRGLWPDAVDGTVLAFACGSGNLELARHCHAFLVASARDPEEAQGIIIDKQAMDLCYLLATAAGGGQDDQSAIEVLNWLHTDLDFPVTGHYTVTGSRWFRRIVPTTWPGAWDSSVSRYFYMEVATRLASTALLDWWHVHAKPAAQGQRPTFFNKPLLSAVSIQQVDPTPVLQWWIDSRLHHLPPGQVNELVECTIQDGGQIEMLDWLLGQLPKRAGESDEDDLFPNRIMSYACRAGRVDVLEWIFANEAKLPAPVFSYGAFDDAYRGGHVKVLQWLVDHRFLDVLRAQDIEQGALSFEYRAISFMPEKWPQCFECLAWSLANGFKISKRVRKKVESKLSFRQGALYSFLLQRQRPWGA